MKRKMVKKGINYYLFEIIFVLANLFIVAIFYRNIFLTTTLVSAIAIIGLVKWKSWRSFIIFLGGAIVGAGVEMFCIYVGVWGYTITNFFNIPLWLFVLWGNAAAVIYQFAIKIKERKMRLT